METSGTSNCSERAARHIAHGDEAHVDQRFADFVAALLLQFERPLQVFFGDQLALDQNLAQPHGVNTFRMD